MDIDRKVVPWGSGSIKTLLRGPRQLSCYPCHSGGITIRIGRHLHHLDPQPDTGSGCALSRIGGHENIGLESHGATYVYGVHAAQYVAFETRHRLAQHRWGQVANGGILNVCQQQ